MNDAPLQIAIIDPVGQKAGMDYYNLSLARQLKNLGCRVKVYSNFASEEDSDIIIKQFEFTFSRSIIHRMHFFIQYISTLRKAKKNGLKILILHLFHSSFAEYLLFSVCKIYGFKICLIIHDVESFITTEKKSRLIKCLDKASCLIVHNETSSEELVTRTGYPKIKISIIPHGNFSEHPPKVSRTFVMDYFKLKHRGFYLLFFGMIKSSKGLEIALEAMQKTDNNVHLIIAGRMRGQSFDLYKKKIEALGLENRVQSFIKYITNLERHYLFSLADIAILPYRRIYQSGVMLFAMSYGVPVIASDLPANKEIINGQNGKLFISGNSDDLAMQINMLINDENARMLLSKKSIDYVNNNHDWAVISKRFMDILMAIKC
jgi:glycosyltransferase involved in cell wall biosynthesis